MFRHWMFRFGGSLVGAAAACAPAAAQVTLLDNGPLVTHPGAGALGLDVSAVQSALGNSKYGFLHQAFSAARVADDFQVPAGQTWTITGIVVYSFQAGAGLTAPTITSMNLRVWSGKPGAPGAEVIWGDTQANVLVQSAFSGVLRARDDDLLNDNRPVFENTLALVPPLVAPGAGGGGSGEYWLDWQGSGVLSSGPWAVPVTIAGKAGKAGANGRVLFSGSWADASDGAPSHKQDFAFRVIGTAGGGSCKANCDGNTDPQGKPILNIDDFLCFQLAFALQDPYADCDGNSIFNIDDFLCFQLAFALGC